MSEEEIRALVREEVTKVIRELVGALVLKSMAKKAEN